MPYSILHLFHQWNLLTTPNSYTDDLQHFQLPYDWRFKKSVIDPESVRGKRFETVISHIEHVPNSSTLTVYIREPFCTHDHFHDTSNSIQTILLRLEHTPNQNPWPFIGMRCVYFGTVEQISKGNLWYRVQILSITSEFKVNVLFIDVGIMRVIEYSDLKKVTQPRMLSLIDQYQQYVISAAFAYKVTLRPVSNIATVVGAMTDVVEAWREREATVEFHHLDRYNKRLIFNYQEIVVNLRVDGRDVYDHLGGVIVPEVIPPEVIPPPVTPCFTTPTRNITKSLDETEYDELQAELSSIPRHESIVSDCNFDVLILRVSNPSEVYAIPNEYQQNNVPDKLQRFLKLHSQIRPLKRCAFIEKDKTYVIRMKQTDMRACVVSKN